MILPAVLFAGLIILALTGEGAAAWVSYPTFRCLPYITLGTALLLGFFFAQTRVSFVSLFLGIVTCLLDRAFFSTGDVEGGRMVILLSAIYFPFVLGLFYQFHERGVLTPYGYIKIAILGSVVVVLVLLPRVGSLRNMVASASTNLVRPGQGIMKVPMVGMIAFVACAACLCVRNTRESPLLGPILCLAALFVFAALNFESAFWPGGAGRSVLLAFMSGSGVVLAWAVMESSWRHAHIDELTQLPGRRSLQHHMAKLGSSYSLAVVDLDHFKKVNDRYGHETGDQVLKFAASMLKKNVAGRAYRQGGEEFVIVCEGNDYDRTLAGLDTLREAIRSREFVIRGSDRPRKKPERPRQSAAGEKRTLAVTVSIGVARRNEKYDTPSEVLEAADRALYRAKKAGRNCLKATK